MYCCVIVVVRVVLCVVLFDVCPSGVCLLCCVLLRLVVVLCLFVVCVCGMCLGVVYGGVCLRLLFVMCVSVGVCVIPVVVVVL